ncbi:MAG: tyrosine-type recombinase/integrase [Devosia sp.]|nr:tyrosine-type recombinase/integrase [Devosia sp.]
MGLHKVRAKLADGRATTYFYAWRGGPRIDVDPAKKRAFAAEFFRLTRARDEASGKGTLAELIRLYLKSPAFTKLRESTRESYQAAIDAIEAEYFDLPLASVSEPGARRLFIEWRDGFAETPRKADMLLTVLARMFSFALDLEMIERNPLEKVGKLADGTRRDAIWTDAQVAAFRGKAHPKLQLAMELARWTGQRQGDLLRLTWSAYDGKHITLRQSKTGRQVRIKVYSELKTLLDATKREAVTILTTSRKKPTPWTGDGFRASWGKVCEEAKVEGVTFHDLRGTFVTLAYRHHGASIREIAEVTGHTERDAEAIIRKSPFENGY